MKFKSIIAASMVSASLVGVPAMAQDNSSLFSSLDQAGAQLLSPEEMAAVSGELNAYDIAAALYAQAARLVKYPKLAASLIKQADWTVANASQINASFVRLRVYTACTTGCYLVR